jgi:hypothetical protein
VCGVDSAHIILATEHYPRLLADFALPKNELLEVHHGKISLHRAKAGYIYFTIQLPHTFSTLAELSTHIDQTVHDGALAFLVVVSSVAIEKGANRSENAALNVESSVTRRQ